LGAGWSIAGWAFATWMKIAFTNSFAAGDAVIGRVGVH
jgi:hypothetical protein